MYMELEMYPPKSEIGNRITRTSDGRPGRTYQRICYFVLLIRDGRMGGMGPLRRGQRYR